MNFQPKPAPTPLDQRTFFLPELYISSENVPLDAVLDRLPNAAAWKAFLKQHPDFYVYIDPRSGTPTNIIGPVPLIPGTGVGNKLTLASLSRELGRPIPDVTSEVVAEQVLRFIRDHQAILAIDVTQLGPVRATQVTDYLWQVHIPQVVGGVPVRYGRVVATINHGNLVLIGTDTWGDVRIDVTPRISEDAALKAGFEYVGGRQPGDRVVEKPRLEVVPIAPPAWQRGEAFAGPIGQGYGHRLVWTWVFVRPPDLSQWEVMVDAHSGEVIAFQDINYYIKKKIVGGVYPLTSTEVCPSPDKCGTLQSGWPMPWADTGLPAPNNFTNSAGLFEYTSGTVTTTLSGKYVRISDACGTISESSSTGDIDLGGTNGQHDCTVPPGHSAGDTASSRSCFYELNRIAELARGWLPTNTWLQSQLTANVNINNTCNAFWDGVTVNFYRSGGGCRNTGEIAAVFDHEWGHGLDDNDANGTISNSGEAYADIAAIYRLQASCVGYGFFWTLDRGCGQTGDGTGFNANESQTGVHCDLDCSGVRDADWDKHADHTPDTPQNFVCGHCNTGTGPCGRQVHCAAAPTRQAAWDFAARDLQAPPFAFDSNTAFIIANKIFYQGSGNVGNWHACTCPSSSDGCGATNGYMQWLAADDDNGNINDGTPHMTALYAAFNRHNIACATPPPTNSGCAGGPTTAPTLTTTPGNNQVALSWTPVSGAQKYWVFRTEGHAGCNFSKTLIATVTTTSYTDSEVANGRQYCYTVMAVGSSNACFGPASTCTCATPAPGPQADWTGQVVQDVCPFGGPGNGNGIIEPGETVTLPVTLTNTGSVNLTGVSGTLSTTTPGVTVTDNAATWPDLPVGGSAQSNPNHFSFQVADTVTCGTGIDFSLNVTYAQGSNVTGANLPVGTTQTTTLLQEDFSGGIPATWTVIDGGSGGGPAATWTTANPCGRSIGPPLAAPWAMVDSDCAGTSATQDEQLITPSLNASSCAQVTLEFSNQFRWYSGGLSEVADVDVSTDGGTTWVNVLRLQGGSDGYPTPNTKVVDLTAQAAGQPNVKIRFHYYNGQFEWWWAIDNVRVTCSTPVCNVCTCALPGAPSLVSPPNGATNVSVTPTLDWGDVTGATAYDVQVCADAACTTVVRSQTGLAASQWTVTPALNPGTTYYWRARAVNACGAGSWTATWSFTTVAPPSALSPAALGVVDPNGNGVWDSGETATVVPAWTNQEAAAVLATGTAGNVVVPPDVTATLTDTTADYGTIPAGATADCQTATGNCYAITGTRTAWGHRDVTIEETLSAVWAVQPMVPKTWTLHIGPSFADVATNAFYYKPVETMLHRGITGGCTATDYCPLQTVTRSQMAIFISRA
ncbi:MAG: hypothetical protein QXS96_08320, partial [Candidatus Caldarchaeum sp.]